MISRAQLFMDTLLISSIQVMLAVAYMVVKILNFVWKKVRINGTIAD